MDILQIKEKLKSGNYAFLREDKNLGSNIMLLTLGGSHAYGMDKEGSDLDIRGIAINSKEDILNALNKNQKEKIRMEVQKYYISLDGKNYEVSRELYTAYMKGKGILPMI